MLAYFVSLIQMAMISLLQISISHPQHVWWALSLPVAALLLWSYHHWQRSKLRQLADARLLPRLLIRYQPRRQRWSRGLLLASFALLSVALINPQRPGQQAGSTLKGMEVMMAIDVSNSMLATDMGASRLEAVKKIALQLLDTLPGSQVGIVAFAGDAWLQLPLTTDLSAARLLLSSLDASSAPEQGTNLAQALQVGSQSLPLTHPAHKALILFTDGEALEGNAEAAAKELKKMGILLLAVGVGTPQGATLTNAEGQTIRQADGAPVISKLQQESLSKLASVAGGQYVGLTQNEQAFVQVLAPLEQLPKHPLLNSYLVNFDSYSYWLIALAIVLLVAGMSFEQAARRSKNLPTAAAAACWLLLAGTLPLFATAQATTPLLTRANDLLASGKTEEAGKLYHQILLQEPANWQAHLNLGNIAYRGNQYKQAMLYYEQTLQQPLEADARLVALNNLGLAQAKQNKPADAVATFKNALRLSPYDEGIQTNLNLALEDLANSKQKPAAPPAGKPLNPKKAADKLQALQQEENKIRQRMQQQKKPAPSNVFKY